MSASDDPYDNLDLAALARRQYASFALPTVALALVIASLFVVWIVLYRSGAIPFWLAFPLQTYTMIVMFNPLHEASHGNITFADKRHGFVDFAVGTLAGFILFQPYPLFRQMHRLHHAKTNVAGSDPDLWTKADRFWVVLLRCISISPVYYWRYGQYALRQSPERRPWAGIVLSALVVLTAAVAVMTFPIEAIGLWIIPAILAIASIEFFHWTLHDPHVSTQPYQNATVIYASGWRHLALRILYQDLNCHLIHHLYPHVPFYRLSAMLPQMVGRLRVHGGNVISLKQAYRQIINRRA